MTESMKKSKTEYDEIVAHHKRFLKESGERIDAASTRFDEAMKQLLESF